MGLSISYPPDDYLPEDDDDGMDRLFVRSLSFDNLSTLETLESPPALLDALTSKRLVVRGSLSFEKREGDPFQVETTLSMVSPKPAKKSYNYKPIILPRYRSTENLPPNSPLSPSEGEEDEWFRQRGSLSELKHTESSNPASQEDSSKIFKKEDSSKSHPAGAADQDKATAKTTPATPPSTSHDKTTTSAATSSGTPAMKRSSSGSRLQRKRPPRLAVSKSRLGKGGWEQGAGTFGDCLDFCKENLFWGGESGDDEEDIFGHIQDSEKTGGMKPPVSVPVQ
ncbi:unnamed protein product [Miscanthus lutarioriparius]|uniref:Uncharacterized protein n=1 Tax=Miscanthus lutarioriparius TaxID=422564 RepID=A0A811M6V6_9POAL|nr:unnamed protein product [Miscanthus lutarioriparius]